MELPGDARVVEDRAGPARRQHLGAQAVAVHAADHADGRADAARRLAAGRVQRRQRRGSARNVDDFTPHPPQDQLHRVGGHRQEGGSRSGARPEADHPRARWQ